MLLDPIDEAGKVEEWLQCCIAIAVVASVCDTPRPSTSPLDVPFLADAVSYEALFALFWALSRHISVFVVNFVYWCQKCSAEILSKRIVEISAPV